MTLKHTPFIILLTIYALFVSCATREIGKSGQEKASKKTYVIIGASSGIGKGVAEKLGSYGANVVLAARRTELLEEIAETIRQSDQERAARYHHYRLRT